MTQAPIWRGRVRCKKKRLRVIQYGMVLKVIDIINGPMPDEEYYLQSGYNKTEVQNWLTSLGYTIESLED